MTTTHRAPTESHPSSSVRQSWRLLTAVTLVVVLAAVLVVVGVVVWHLRTAAPSVPYADPAVTGRLTLCSADGTPLTTGSVTDRPFAAVVVGGTAASGGYAGAGRTATLLAAQPRAGVDAEEWSTLQLTPGDAYADPAHPQASPDATGTTLGQFLTAYPATDSGWVQLRLVLGGVGLPAQTQSYAAVDLHVSGDVWTVANPGSASCPTHS